MEIKEAMKQRHSVRRYLDKPIEEKNVRILQNKMDQINKETGMHIQLCLNEPKAFQGMMAHYGKFRNVKNYIALIGKRNGQLDKLCGYYGEQLVLKATQLGLSTCWVAMSHRKRKTECVIENDEKLCCVIALGYGETKGIAHSSKPIEQLCEVDGEMPEWFVNAMKCVQLAPTAMNQQKFLFSLKGNSVSVKTKRGSYTWIDLGIVTYHFEVGAEGYDWKWADHR